MKRFLAVMVALVLSLSFAACTEQKEPVQNSPEETICVDTENTDTGETFCEYGEAMASHDPGDDSLDAKPVIYLYPEEEMEVSVKLGYAGTLTSTYPAYENGWTVTAQPDGTLTDKNGREYYCLFWEGVSDTEYDFTEGFVVPGDETEEFLEEALAQLGLTEKEANEFIIYWLPQMEHNTYNLIAFQNEVYTENAELTITPAPDSMLRVFMAWKPVEEPVEIEPQTLKPFERTGFAVVEWGGAKVS